LRFEKKYPNPEHLKVYKEGVMWYNGRPGKCWNCNKPTQWIDIDFQAHLCSEECAIIKWREYEIAMKRLYEKGYYLENN